MRKIDELPGSWRAKHDRVPPEPAKVLYVKAMELAAKDSSPVKIARRLSEVYSFSLSPRTVRHWTVGDRKPQGSNVFRNVFKEGPWPALSYIVGANKGDGCTLVKSGMVKLEVTDKDFAQEFNPNMAALFSRAKPNRIFVRRRADTLPMYIVKYSSRQLVRLLRQPLRKLLETATAFPREFLRGFFGAEGHADVWASGKRFQIYAGVENSNIRLLRRIKQILLTVFQIRSIINRKRKAGSLKVIRGRAFRMRKTSFTLLICRFDDLQKFARQIGFSIARKNQKLEDAFSVIAKHHPKERAEKWARYYFKLRDEWVKRQFHGSNESKVLMQGLFGPSLRAGSLVR